MLKCCLVSLWIFFIQILHNFSVNPSSTKQAWTLALLFTNNFTATHAVIYKRMFCGLAVTNFSALNKILTNVSSNFYCAFLSPAVFFIHLICLALNFFYFFNVCLCCFYLFLKFFDKFLGFFLRKIQKIRNFFIYLLRCRVDQIIKHRSKIIVIKKISKH